MLLISLYMMLALNTTNFDSLFLFSFRSNYFLISCVTFFFKSSRYLSVTDF